MEEAAALPLAALTSYQALHSHVRSVLWSSGVVVVDVSCGGGYTVWLPSSRLAVSSLLSLTCYDIL
jgi:hypothetical protein